MTGQLTLLRNRRDAIALAEQRYQINIDNLAPDLFEYVISTLQEYSNNYCEDCCRTGQKITFDPPSRTIITDTCPCKIRYVAAKGCLRRMRESGIPAKYQNARIDGWFNPGQNDQEVKINQDSFDVISSYIQNIANMRNNGLGIFFCGPHGVGKTFLACSVGAAAVASGYVVSYATLTKLVELKISSWFNEEGTEESRAYREADFLILDDIDKIYRTKTGIETRVFDNLIRERLQNNLPILATTNLPREKMKEDFGNAIYSMLLEQNAELVFVGTDDRQKNAGDVRQRIINGG